MARNKIRIEKDSYRLKQFDRVIDREFKTFTEPQPEVDNDTVEELFRLYDKLFYSIPIEGESNSHQFIIKKSSELATYEKYTEDIQPLLDEIANLRQQLLETNETLLEFESTSAEGISDNDVVY
jgi:hypothetical protein